MHPTLSKWVSTLELFILTRKRTLMWHEDSLHFGTNRQERMGGMAPCFPWQGAMPPPPKRLQKLGKLENWSGPPSQRVGETRANSVARGTRSTFVGEPGYKSVACSTRCTTSGCNDCSVWYEFKVEQYFLLRTIIATHDKQQHHTRPLLEPILRPRCSSLPHPPVFGPVTVQSRDSSSSSSAFSGRRPANYENRDTMHWEEAALKASPLAKFLLFVVSNVSFFFRKR